MKQRLKFRSDNTFTIVQFTDIHYSDGTEADLKSVALMDRIIEHQRPDLIVFTGDIVEARRCLDPRESLKLAVSAAERHAVPWAAVFGNHDTEEKITREELMDVIAGQRWSLTERGPEEVNGCGNYILTIDDADGRHGAALYFLDSGSVSCIPHVKGYGWIHRNQIGWYERQSRELAARNGGTPLPSLAFFHIPLPEYQQVWDREVCYGEKHEQVCSPPINSGLFAAMIEMGDVMGTFAGHDHINDYWGTLHGIRLCYGRATGYNTYGREGFRRGARVIRLQAGERSFKTWLRLDDGSVVLEQTEHRPAKTPN